MRIGLLMIVLFLGINAFGQTNTLNFTVRKPGTYQAMLADSDQGMYRRLVGDTITTLLPELIQSMPGKWETSDSSLFFQRNLEVESFFLIFQYDTIVVSVDHWGGQSEELYMALGRLRPGSVFYIGRIRVENTAIRRKYSLQETVLAFRKS